MVYHIGSINIRILQSMVSGASEPGRRICVFWSLGSRSRSVRPAFALKVMTGHGKAEAGLWQKLGVLFRSPYKKNHSLLASILKPPMCGKRSFGTDWGPSFESMSVDLLNWSPHVGPAAINVEDIRSTLSMDIADDMKPDITYNIQYISYSEAC